VRRFSLSQAYVISLAILAWRDTQVSRWRRGASSPVNAVSAGSFADNVRRETVRCLTTSRLSHPRSPIAWQKLNKQDPCLKTETKLSPPPIGTQLERHGATRAVAGHMKGNGPCNTR